jgi:membrane protease YdiL (CAAX protease family)
LDHQLTFRNAWVRRVDGARRHPATWVVLLLAAAAVLMSLTGGVALYRLSAPLKLDPLTDRAVLYVCVEALLYLTAAGMLAYENRALCKPNIGVAAQLFIGAVFGFAGFGLAVGVSQLFGVIVAGSTAPAPMAHRLAGMAAGLGLVAFQAYGEELFFRGWLQPILAARWGPAVGIGATSILFAVAHGLVRPLGILALVNDTLAGLAFGVIAFRSGGLIAPFAAHFAWNWAEQSVLGLTPNPGVDPLGSLFDLDLKGPAMLSGGPDELNGAVGATLGLLAIIACALWWRPGRSAVE